LILVLKTQKRMEGISLHFLPLPYSLTNILRIKKRKTHSEESDPNEFDTVEKRPKYTRMSRKYLSPGVLNKYKIDYMIDDMV
jgi:hypothetical protein